jgi:hypothetical protein
MKLPPERDFGWDLKQTDSAKTGIYQLPSGQKELTIEHETVRGITTEMLRWWFQEFPRLTVTKDGEEYPVYHLWHPSDHISVDAVPPGKVRQGHHLVINEAFQRNPEYHVQEKAEVYYLDHDGIGLRVTKLGQPVMQLRHEFEDISSGVRYRSRMVVGAERGLLKQLINRVIVPRNFGPGKANTWFRHNIEEVGCFEQFLPELYAERHQGRHVIL